MSDAEDQLAIAWSSEGLPDELKASVKLELVSWVAELIVPWKARS